MSMNSIMVLTLLSSCCLSGATVVSTLNCNTGTGLSFKAGSCTLGSRGYNKLVLKSGDPANGDAVADLHVYSAADATCKVPLESFSMTCDCGADGTQIVCGPSVARRPIRFELHIASENFGKAIAGSNECTRFLEQAIQGDATCVNVCVVSQATKHCTPCGEASKVAQQVAQHDPDSIVVVTIDVQVLSTISKWGIQRELSRTTFTNRLEGFIGKPLLRINVNDVKEEEVQHREQPHVHEQAGNSELSSGAVAGIILGSIVIIGLVAFLVFCCLRKQSPMPVHEPTKEEPDNIFTKNPEDEKEDPTGVTIV
eukprot:TRINITY_DN3175_c0_g1_i1.p1 TRINITY_DN3175_c0_g1~~TRINITY_DN3175_c0_g1_i1.p1  ORF type:complete len:318 (+),score=53.35 TRINITY_DN3175_c0_g1_i1:23-955(+)